LKKDWKTVKDREREEERVDIKKTRLYSLMKMKAIGRKSSIK
jgi:hypothetical protein